MAHLMRASVAALCVMAMVMGQAVAADEAALAKIKAHWERAAKDVKDMTIEQEVTMSTPRGKMVNNMTIQRKGEKSRTETDMGGMKMTMIFDGKELWMVTPMGAQKSPLRQQQMPDYSYRSLPEGTTVVGTEKVNDRDCYIVEIKGEKAVDPMRLWIDQSKPLIVKSEVKQGNQTMTTVFSDFRKTFKDYEMPYKGEMTMDGKPMGTMVVKSAKFNAGLDDSLFEVKASDAPTFPFPAPK